MTVTVSGLNLTVLDDCEATTYNDAGGTDGVDYKEGSYSCYWTLKTSGNNDATFTPLASKDFSGTKHIRFWGVFVQGGLIDLEVNGGIQFFCSDGVNTGYWNLAGRDTYPGGWQPFVIDVSRSVDAGTKPTAMNAITSFGVRIVLTANGKNFANSWIDNFTICDGLIAYGDDAGGSFDIENIFSADNDPVLGIGILQKFGGVYYCGGELVIGDSVSTNACDFNPTDQTLIFLDKLVDSSLYGITVIDNGTGITDFQMGTKVGTAGVSGCTIGVEDLTQTPLWTFDASDVDVDYFKLYGCTLFGASSMTFPPTATNVEILNSNFSDNGLIGVNTAIVKYCNFINAVGDGAIEIDTATHNVSECNFINNAYAIEHSIQGTYTYTGMKFSGNTKDIYYTAAASSGILTINSIQPGSDVSTYEILNPTGNSVTIISAVNLTITTIDSENDPVGNVSCSIHKTSDDSELLNEDSNAVTGIATESIDYPGTPFDIYWRVRESPVAGPRYINKSGVGQIDEYGFTQTVTMELEPVS